LSSFNEIRSHTDELIQLQQKKEIKAQLKTGKSRIARLQNLKNMIADFS